jgi:hypothetical protein
MMDNSAEWFMVMEVGKQALRGHHDLFNFWRNEHPIRIVAV